MKLLNGYKDEESIPSWRSASIKETSDLTHDKLGRGVVSLVNSGLKIKSYAWDHQHKKIHKIAAVVDALRGIEE